MRILNDFEYEQPRTLMDALVLLDQHRESARPLAGGTDVVVNMKYRSMLQLFQGAGTRDAGFKAAGRVPPMDEPRVLVSLTAIEELYECRIEDGALVIGPLITMTRFANMSNLPESVMGLQDACAIMGSPLIRNRATIGGNLVNARPAADTAVALIALGAEIGLMSKDRSRIVDVAGFITSPGKTIKEPHEIIHYIKIPLRPLTGSAYLRQGVRKQLEIALVGAAAWIEIDAQKQVVRDARICLGAVGPTPIMAGKAAQSLIGQKPSSKLFDLCAKTAGKEAAPIDDFRGSAAYRVDLVEVLTRRAIEEAARRAGVSGDL